MSDFMSRNLRTPTEQINCLTGKKQLRKKNRNNPNNLLEVITVTRKVSCHGNNSEAVQPQRVVSTIET